MKEYRVRYERDARSWWVATAPDVPGCHTQGRTLAEARRRIRDALSLFVPDADRAELVEDVQLPATVRKALRDASARRQDAETARERATGQLRRSARLLVEDLGLSRRDAAELLGISHQRVHQLVVK